MQDFSTVTSLRWTPDELSYGKLASNYTQQFGFAPGIDWTFDEIQDEYRCTFEERRKISVRISRLELLADFGRSALLDSAKRKLDDAMGLQSGPKPSPR